MSIITMSPAKLNLFLHITSQREDGYHDLQTVFRLLDWGDEMRFEVSQDIFKQDVSEQNSVQNNLHPIRLHCSHQITDNIENNLILKAAKALLKPALDNMQKQELKIIDIYLEKNIPMGAGLGGGSSNAATTMCVLNKLWNIGLSNHELQEIGCTLGADVPIFIYNQDAIAEGIGEIFTPIELPEQQFLLLTPITHVSTAELFSSDSLQRDVEKLPIDYLIHHKNSFLDKLDSPFRNVFEDVVCQLNDEVAEALAYLRQFEPLTNTKARMTGSGGAIFLPLSKDINPSFVDTWMEFAPCNAILVRSLR